MFNNIEIITVSKVGSANFKYACEKHYNKVFHTHSLLHLKNVLNKKTNTLIISGIRNPLDRNISYFFQSFGYNKYNTLKMKSNNYKGEYMYIKDLNLQPIFLNNFQTIQNNTEQLIQYYFKYMKHYTFNDWFKEFFKLTKIEKLPFNKELGYTIYDLPNNNKLLLYKLENLNNNKLNICQYIGIDDLININDNNNRYYKNNYKEFKNKIKFTNDYKNQLLNTKYMKYFYTDDEIKMFYNKY